MPEPVLATDLDGTLIPLEDSPENQQDLATLRAEFQSPDRVLAFVTGRHIESVEEAIRTHDLPRPDWIICDVGTTICHVREDGTCEVHQPYGDYLATIVGEYTAAKIRELMTPVKGLTPQEDEKQGRFKISFYAEANQLRQLVARIEKIIAQQDAPYSVVDSVDPFNGDGLIDLLPRGISKAHALDWWCERQGHERREIVFAGDSGNDYAALIAGYRTIVVANATQDLVDAVHQAHQEEAWTDRLFSATAKATSGVLEGCRHFGICP